MQTTPVFYHPSSYRDPSGFIFEKEDTVFRQVNIVFKDQYNHFISSGCYNHLQKKELLISHEEVKNNLLNSPDYYVILKPEKISFISYPYEWSFEMLKDAALLTLQLVKECLPFGVILKDATPYNIQWHHGKLIFIDTLSFEKYDSSTPWIAYRQFCECFLSPLLLMHYTDQPLQPLLLAYPEGIPLSISKSLLPWRSRFSFHTYLHIHLHEKFSSKSIGKEAYKKNNFSEKKLQRLIDSLQSLIQSLQWKGRSTTWGNYYEEANQRSDYLEQKKNIITSWIKELPEIRTAVDLGANEGEFSHLLAKKNIRVIATDFEHTPINNLYKRIIKESEKNILPLIIDLANPSPSIGLNNEERVSFIERTRVDLSLALALIHHLAIGKNIPFEKVAELFNKISNYVIIEFVPKSDEKVQHMLSQKKDIYYNYTEENFVKIFEKYFSIIDKKHILGTERVLFLMKKN
jgi:hypothetical protein